jgi:hypothetical protein
MHTIVGLMRTIIGGGGDLWNVPNGGRMRTIIGVGIGPHPRSTPQHSP